MLTEERMRIISELDEDKDYMKTITPRIHNRCSETDIDAWIKEARHSVKENQVSDFLCFEI